jgi:integrase
MKVEFLALTEQAHPLPLALELAGKIAGDQSRRRFFLQYQERRDVDTCRQQRITLNAFRTWLANAAADPGDLFSEPAAWSGITWGLVSDFIRHELSTGYAVSTVNARLGTIKRYAALALQAGALPHPEYTMIKVIQGYSRREAINLDRERLRSGLAIRRQGAKAAEPIVLSDEQMTVLLDQSTATAQACRDRFLLHLFLHHGLRCGEVAGLKRSTLHLTMKGGELVFYRPKVNKQQTHTLTEETFQAAELYLDQLEYEADSLLIRGSHRSGELLSAGMSERAITARVKVLGQQIGVEGLSAHDLRHTWATMAARAGTGLLELQEAGGWSSLAMPRRYIEAAKVANAGVRLR